MKARDGFVSNSSSTAFILDYRNQKTRNWVESVKGKVNSATSTGRGTALSVGLDAFYYAINWVAVMEKWADGEGLGYWILDWAEFLGKDNIVFVRESDEGMGGYLPSEPPRDCIVSKREYH